LESRRGHSCTIDYFEFGLGEITSLTNRQKIAMLMTAAHHGLNTTGNRQTRITYATHRHVGRSSPVFGVSMFGIIANGNLQMANQAIAAMPPFATRDSSLSAGPEGRFKESRPGTVPATFI
jgi:hypothetical protein